MEREFWREIAKGITTEDAATAVGVSQAVGGRWFRHGGGMAPMDLAPLTGRYLAFSEREDIAMFRAEGTRSARDRSRVGTFTVDDLA